MFGINFKKLTESKFGQEAGSILKILLVDKVAGTALGTFTKAKVKENVEDGQHAEGQAPRFGGLTFDDEAIQMAVDAAVGKHFPDDLAKIAAVRAALSLEENRRWRMALTTIKIDGLQALNHRGKVTKTGKPGTDKFQEVVEALTVPVTPLSRDDPRVQHMHAVAGMVIPVAGPPLPGASPLLHVSGAVTYLKHSFLNHHSFSEQMKAAEELVKQAIEALSPVIGKMMKVLGPGLGRFAARFILDPDVFSRINNRRMNPVRKDRYLARAIDVQTARIRAETCALENESVAAALWRLKWWFAPAAVAGVLIIII